MLKLHYYQLSYENGEFNHEFKQNNQRKINHLANCNDCFEKNCLSKQNIA